jgi:Protein of unknown function (DUF2795)
MTSWPSSEAQFQRSPVLAREDVHRQSALIQAVLEGVPLPASRDELLEYAWRQEVTGDVVRLLERIEDREYDRLDAVGEEIARAQPGNEPPSTHRPAVESDDVPGGEAYTDPKAEPGTIRESPEILEYEEQLVREPAPPGEGSPSKGDRDEKP